MNAKIFHSEKSEPQAPLSDTITIGKSNRVLFLSQSKEIVKQRLQEGFAHDIIKHGGLFFPTYKYKARFENDLLVLDYTKSGRHWNHYKITALLLSSEEGCKLEMTVSNSFYTYLEVAAGIVITLFAFLIKSIYWPAIMVVPMLLAVVEYNRSEAADNTASLLTQMAEAGS